jgi:hypothetical protein
LALGNPDLLTDVDNGAVKNDIAAGSESPPMAGTRLGMNGKTNVQQNDDFCNLITNQIRYTVILVL